MENKENASVISPEEFRQKMAELRSGIDPETAHWSMDLAMAELLESLGYGAGVEIWRKQKRWYA